MWTSAFWGRVRRGAALVEVMRLFEHRIHIATEHLVQPLDAAIWPAGSVGGLSLRKSDDGQQPLARARMLGRNARLDERRQRQTPFLQIGTHHGSHVRP